MKNIKSQLKIKSSSIVFLLIFVLLFTGTQAFAAEFHIDSKYQEIKPGEQFEIKLFLNTEGEYINAIEGKITFPADLLTLKEIKDGNSIVTFWIEHPEVVVGNQITFSGIIPGGYSGETGLVFSAIFKAQGKGRGEIDVNGVRALLNNGEGSETSATISKLEFTISEQITKPQIQIIEAEDIDPPEPFKAEVAKDPSVFEGKYFLVFATQDKGSGIDHYEIREGGKQFVIAESPYQLLNQDLDKKIIVKAIDKNGNVRVVILPPPHPLPWYKNYLILAILIVIGAAAAYILRKIVWRKFIR